MGQRYNGDGVVGRYHGAISCDECGDTIVVVRMMVRKPLVVVCVGSENELCCKPNNCDGEGREIGVGVK